MVMTQIVPKSLPFSCSSQYLEVFMLQPGCIRSRLLLRAYCGESAIFQTLFPVIYLIFTQAVDFHNYKVTGPAAFSPCDCLYYGSHLCNLRSFYQSVFSTHINLPAGELDQLPSSLLACYTSLCTD